MDFPVGHCGGSSEYLAEIARLLQSDIFPRLVSARRQSSGEAPEKRVSARSVGKDEVAELARLSLAPEDNASSAYVSTLINRGLPAEALYLGLLGPAARFLGQLWEDDACDFTQVTVGLWRLQQIAHEVAPLLQTEPCPDSGHRRILLSAAPGEQHTLGLFMVSEFFLRAGWDVWGAPTATMDHLMHLAGEQWFDVVGLSSGRRSHLYLLASAIAGIRQASRNPHIGLMVGGPVFLATPDLVAEVGAHATARDARDAPGEAEILLARLGRSFSGDIGEAAGGRFPGAAS